MTREENNMGAARLSWSGTQAELKYVVSQSSLDGREKLDGNLHTRLDALSEDAGEPRFEANDTIRVANGICGMLQTVGRLSIRNIQRVEEYRAPEVIELLHRDRTPVAEWGMAKRND